MMRYSSRFGAGLTTSWQRDLDGHANFPCCNVLTAYKYYCPITLCGDCGDAEAQTTCMMTIMGDAAQVLCGACGDAEADSRRRAAGIQGPRRHHDCMHPAGTGRKVIGQQEKAVAGVQGFRRGKC